MSSMMDWALLYQQMGLSIIPTKGKVACVKWKEFQTRKATEDEIRKWWEQFPEADIGLVTGPISRRLVLDIDGDKGRQYSNSRGIPSTPSVRTRKGTQHHFNWPDGLPENVKTTDVGIEEEIDTRGEGGIALLPPSLCSDGTRYEWLTDMNLPLAEAPQWYIDLLSKPKIGTFDNKESKEADWIAEALENLTDGTKHDQIVSVLGRLRHDNYTKKTAFAFVSPYTREVGVKDEDIWERIESIWGLYQGKEQHHLGEGYIEPIRTELVSVKVDTNKYLEEIQERTKFLEPEFKTGFKYLDRLTRGFQRQNIFVIGAPTNGGKTQFVLSSIHELLKTGKRVLYFSTEMPQNEIKDRFNAIGAHIPLDELRTGFLHRENKAKLITYLNSLDVSNFIISPEDAPSIETIRMAVNEANPDIIFLDHIHEIKFKSDNRRTDIDDFISGLKKLILEKNIPCVVTAQLRRKEGFNGKPPVYTMHDFKESGGIENKAGVCLLLCPPDEWTGEKIQKVTGYIPKNRHGRREVRFQLEFDTEIPEFRERFI